jgi:hypothetical protein
VLVRVEAVAVENVDRAIVAGTHYTAAQFQAALPAIPCFPSDPESGRIGEVMGHRRTKPSDQGDIVHIGATVRCAGCLRRL